MSNERRKFTPELEEIFKEAYSKVEKAGGRVIPFSLVSLLILEKYFKGPGEDIRMKSFIKSLSLSPLDKKQLLDEGKKIISEVMEDEVTFLNPGPEFPFPMSGEADSSIVLDLAFTTAIKRAEKQNELYFSKSAGEPIETSNLFLSGSWDLGEPILEDLYSAYGITKRDFMDHLMGTDFSISKMKVKNITPNEDSNDTYTLGSMEGNEPKMETPDDSMFEEAGKRYDINSKEVNPDSKTPNLDLYAYEMTGAAKMGKFDPVVGRALEISQIEEILCCRKKNNAVLLGDPGCGKTAVVELLAQKIVSGDVPGPLKGKRIFSLDLNSLVAGTQYRGQYEQRLQNIIKEVCSSPDIIVYIDEFHNLIGNGGSAGNGDAANILKPYLARGEFQCIGSTTVDEYRKWIEKDGALKRRFQNVYIDEPTSDDTLQILTGLAKKYENYHSVKYTPEILKACVDWSGRYIQDRYFPDKAIDCMDMAGSLAKLRDLPEAEKIVTPLDKLKKELEEVTQKKVNAIVDKRFDEGMEVWAREKELKKQIELETKRCGKTGRERKDWPEVTTQDVAKVISKISKVPIDKISESDMMKIRDMKVALESSVIGQPEAIGKVTTSLQRNLLGLRDPKKPIASLLFVGPTGTGKTLICREMAKEFFGSEKALIKFDMAEFSEHHEVTKLTGSTASYVGYDDSPLLEQVRRQPYSVVLFDEIEKAAPEIFNIFLSILDEGTVTLGNGQRVDFKNCIIIFTGNIGTKELALTGKGIGFGGKSGQEHKKNQESIVKKAVEKEFRPEFINRLTSITVFNELGTTEMLKIFDLEIKKLATRLKESGFSLSVDKKVKELCVSECDPKYGARDLQRAITRNIEDEVCHEMISVTSGTGEIGKYISVSISPTDPKKVVVTFSSSGKKRTTKKSTVKSTETIPSSPEALTPEKEEKVES